MELDQPQLIIYDVLQRTRYLEKDNIDENFLSKVCKASLLYESSIYNFKADDIISMVDEIMHDTVPSNFYASYDLLTNRFFVDIYLQYQHLSTDEEEKLFFFLDDEYHELELDSILDCVKQFAKGILLYDIAFENSKIFILMDILNFYEQQYIKMETKHNPNRFI